MSLDVGKVCDLIELWAGRAGVDRERINPVLLREIVNIKLREFCRETGILNSSWTIDSVADQTEYELPDDCAHVRLCYFDDYEAHKIVFEQVGELAGTVS